MCFDDFFDINGDGIIDAGEEWLAYEMLSDEDEDEYELDEIDDEYDDM